MSGHEVETPALVRQLADGHWHSVAQLHNLFEKYANTLEEFIAKLHQLGIAVEFHNTLGYRIIGGLDLLCDETITQLFIQYKNRQPLTKVHSQWLLDSTNDVALAWLDSDKPNGSLLLAETQCRGRGRGGNQWISPAARNIYLSVLWRFNGDVDNLTGLSLAVGVQIVRALEHFGFCGLGLKWPNDVLWQKRKLAGVLVELKSLSADVCGIVVGIGINCRLTEQERKLIDQPTTDLYDIAQYHALGAIPSRNELAAILWGYLEDLLAQYQYSGFLPWQPHWEELNVFAGKKVSIRHGTTLADRLVNNTDIVGIAEGVDVTGGLWVRTPNKRILCKGGIVDFVI